MQAAFVQTRQGAAEAPVPSFRQLEEPHRPLQCRHAKCSTSLCTFSVDKSRISTCFCFQTSPGATQAHVE
jgi:hypothetical protein